MAFENQLEPDEDGLYELKCGGPIVEPVVHKVYTKEQIKARLEGKKGFQAIYDEYAKIEEEEDAILAERAKSTKAADPEDEDAIIEANTGDFTAEDIKAALESRTPAMQALLTARPDKS